jgi:hypothetical protein
MSTFIDGLAATSDVLAGRYKEAYRGFTQQFGGLGGIFGKVTSQE